MSSKQNLESIFLEAVEIDSADQRAEFIRSACGGDDDLIRRVEELVDAHHQSGTILDSSAGPLSRASDSRGTGKFSVDEIGSKIGNYKLLQQIGEGGFGVVYMAEQLEPVQRKVALKIIKPGMDSKQVIARFEVERQALSMMDHPNIARVLDGGTTENGRPYFVMDLVRGVPLTEYCDKSQLALDDRLKLFVDVCSAVQHAHHKGIIHRDLKPSNVMVTLHDGNPVPKVIDFGVAKALNQKLTEKTLFTQYGQMIGTPAYMSPEQAEMSGLDIDTRSDIYSLGVLLYELLTGATPFDGDRLQTAGYAEMQRIITQEEPIRPSTRLSTESKEQKILSKRGATDLRNLRKSVSGELDWIVMKALEKDRKRRYESASSMASDVQRFLNGEQVEACPPTIAYRMSKLVKRNRTAIGFALVASVLMIATTIICFLLAVKAQNAEALALDRLEQSEQARAESEKVARFLIDLIESVDPRHSHEPVTAIGLLKQAEERLDSLDHHPELKANLQRKLASAYRSLGDHHSGCDLQRQVLDYWLAHYGWEKDQTFHTSFNMVRFYVNTDQFDEALELSELTLSEARRKFGDAHPLTAFAKQEFARAMIEKGRTVEAVELLESVLRYQLNEFGEADRQVAGTMVTLARAYGMNGRAEDALTMREKAVDAYVSICGVTDPATLRAKLIFANSLVAARDYDRAIPLLEQLSLQCQSVLGEGHDLALGVQQNLRTARAESEREAKNNGQQLKTPFDENPQVLPQSDH